MNRFNPYTAIHKAYRAFLFDTLLRLGRVDVEDAHDLGDTLSRLSALLSSLEHHARHEDVFLHPLLAQAGGLPLSAQEHKQHRAEIEMIRSLATDLENAVPDERDARALTLYVRTSSFVAQNLEHMIGEEKGNTAVLWSTFSDAQLIEVHGALVASIEPHVFSEIMSWMLPSLTPGELLAVISDAQSHAPTEAFNALLALASSSLSAARFTQLMNSLPAAAASLASMPPTNRHE